MDRWMDGWMDRWMDGWMNGWRVSPQERDHEECGGSVRDRDSTPLTFGAFSRTRVNPREDSSRGEGGTL